MKQILALFTTLLTALLLTPLAALHAADAPAKRPNVLFIAVDDLNDWIGCLGGHPQTKWKQGVQAYLASIHFADAMLGRVLDALEKGPHLDNTIVVLWSDHGWHLGEKEHWQKFTGWRVCARVPLMVRVPKGVPGLPDGTRAGSICDRPVSLVDLFGTLTELCGLPAKDGIESRSLVPLLRDPSAPWPHVAITHLDRPENYAISTEKWRYIHYFDGGEELYDIATDPHEWTNLAGTPDRAAKLAEMRSLAPQEVAPLVSPNVKEGEKK